MRITRWIMVAGLAGWCVRAGGQESPGTQAANPGNPLQEVVDLENAFSKAQNDFFQEYGKAAPDERAKLLESRPQREDYFARFLALARKYAGEPAAARSLVWVLQAHSAGETVSTRDRLTNTSYELPSEADLLQVLERDHLQSEHLQPLFSAFGEHRLSPTAIAFAERVYEENPSESVQGSAAYALAMMHLGMLKLKGQLTDDAARERITPYYGKDTVELVDAFDRAELSAEVEARLEEVADDFGHVAHPFRGTLAKAASSDLFELRNLSIGKVAPDIEGTDIDGASFKLSDYRGKVVLLDFWGHW